MSISISKNGFTVNYDGKYQIEYKDEITGEESAFRVTREFAQYLVNCIEAYESGAL